MKFGKKYFSFKVLTEDTVANAIKDLPTCKESILNDIPVSIMKETIDAYCLKLTQIMNDCLKKTIFFLIYLNMLK